MQEIVDSIIQGRWFSGETAPFKCSLTWDNPKLVIITGPNACGKSVLRKILHNRASEAKLMYVNTSQEGRIQSSGLERLMLYGTETDDSTGYNSVKQLTKCFQSIKSYEKPCVVMLDEPEIGCSEEVQAAIGQRIAQEWSQPDNMLAVRAFFIITHSRQVVKHALPANPSHWRLCDDGMSLEQFVNREVVPVNLEQMMADSKETWHAVNRVMKN